MALMDWFLGLLQAAGMGMVTSSWVYLTLVGAGVAGLIFWSPLWSVRREIGRFLSHTGDFAARSPANAEALDQYFAGERGGLAECWKSYAQARNDPLLHWAEGRYPDVAAYFPASLLIEKVGRRRLAEAIPGALTAFGILGTFAGLSVGLRGLTVSDVDLIRTSINKLLGGMNVAFYSSVIAISCSIVWLGMDRYVLGKALADLERLHDRLLTLLPAPGEPELLQQMLRAQEEHTSTIKSYLGDYLVPALVDGFGNAVEAKVVPELEKSTKTLVEALPGIATVFREAVEASLIPQIQATTVAVREFTQAGAAKQVEGVQQMATEFLRALDGQVREQFDNLALLVRELMDASTKLTADASLFAHRMEELAILNETVGGKVADMLSVLGAYTEEFRNFHGALESAVRGMGEAGEQAREFHVQLGEHLGSMSDLQSGLNDTWTRLSAEMEPRVARLAEVWEETQAAISNLNGGLEQSAVAFASNLDAGLDRTFRSFDDNLARATTHLAGSLGQMNETVDQVSMQLGQFRKLGAEVSAAVAGLQNVVTDISGRLGQLEQALGRAVVVVRSQEEEA